MSNKGPAGDAIISAKSETATRDTTSARRRASAIERSVTHLARTRDDQCGEIGHEWNGYLGRVGGGGSCNRFPSVICSSLMHGPSRDLHDQLPLEAWGERQGMRGPLPSRSYHMQQHGMLAKSQRCESVRIEMKARCCLHTTRLERGQNRAGPFARGSAGAQAGKAPHWQLLQRNQRVIFLPAMGVSEKGCRR